MNIPNRYIDLANMYVQAEKYEEAMECVNHYLEVYPDDADELEFREEILQKIKNA